MLRFIRVPSVRAATRDAATLHPKIKLINSSADETSILSVLSTVLGEGLTKGFEGWAWRRMPEPREELELKQQRLRPVLSLATG